MCFFFFLHSQGMSVYYIARCTIHWKGLYAIWDSLLKHNSYNLRWLNNQGAIFMARNPASFQHDNELKRRSKWFTPFLCHCADDTVHNRNHKTPFVQSPMLNKCWTLGDNPNNSFTHSSSLVFVSIWLRHHPWQKCDSTVARKCWTVCLDSTIWCSVRKYGVFLWRVSDTTPKGKHFNHFSHYNVKFAGHIHKVKRWCYTRSKFIN